MINKYQPRVSIIMVNFNGSQDTIELVESLKKIDYKNYHIIIVDNGSKDESVKKIKSMNFRNITLIENRKNLGLAEGTNVGLREGIKKKSDYILTMNNDMIVKPDFLTHLVESMENHPEAAVCGPKINYFEPRDVIWCAGCKYRIYGFEPLRQGEKDDKKEEERYVDGLDCALMFRSGVLKKIGLLDKELFIIQEFTGWCLTATKKGHKCIYVPKSLIWHKVSASLEKEKNKNETITYYTIRNWLIVTKKNTSLIYFLAVLFLEATGLALIRGYKYWVMGRFSLIRTYYIAIWHALTGKTPMRIYPYQKNKTQIS